MELFRRASKVLRFVTIKDDVIHIYLDYNTVAAQKQLMGIAVPLYLTFTCLLFKG
jgi:hypothetical protein